MPRRSGQLADPTDHAVRFYGDDGELADAVGGYLAEGLRSGDGVLVMATEPHRRAFAENLAGDDIDVSAQDDAGMLLMADAAGQLDRFLAGDRLDHELFESVAAGLIDRVAGAGRPVRVYAEMVALLWDAGQVALAIELEELWNGLGARLPFSLLCGYPARLLADADQADAVRQMSGLHSSVIDAASAVRGVRDGAAPDGQAAGGHGASRSRAREPSPTNWTRSARPGIS
jgi:hypothetical protein